jgi:hypothetical protein
MAEKASALYIFVSRTSEFLLICEMAVAGSSSKLTAWPLEKDHFRVVWGVPFAELATTVGTEPHDL